MRFSNICVNPCPSVANLFFLSGIKGTHPFFAKILHGVYTEPQTRFFATLRMTGEGFRMTTIHIKVK